MFFIDILVTPSICVVKDESQVSHIVTGAIVMLKVNTICILRGNDTLMFLSIGPVHNIYDVLYTNIS